MTVLIRRTDQMDEADGIGDDSRGDSNLVVYGINIAVAAVDYLTSHNVSGPSIHTDPNHTESALCDCLVYDDIPNTHICRSRQRIKASICAGVVVPILIPFPHIVVATGRVGRLIVHRDVHNKIQRTDSEVVGGHIKNVLGSASQLNITVTVGLQVYNRMEFVDIPQDENPRLWIDEDLAKESSLQLGKANRRRIDDDMYNWPVSQKPR